jgi:zinc protease
MRLALFPRARSVVVAVVAAAALLCLGEAGRAQQGNAGAAQEVTRATLTNGLRVIIVRNPLAPVVTTVINYLVGSDETTEEFPGMAHATEHMMFRGSPGLSADQLAEVTAALGGDFDADTQQALTQYFMTTPSEDLDVALRIESLRMRGLAEDESLWTKERGAIEQEVAQDYSNPSYVFYMRLLKIMFNGTPYAHDALGTRPSFDQTTGAMLRQFQSQWYAPNNAILIVAGNVDPAAAIKEITAQFGDIASRKLPERPGFNFQPVKAETIRLDTDQPYGSVFLTFRFPGSDSPDYAAATILSDVLSSQRGDLYGLVPQGKALFAGFSYENLPKAGLGYAEGAFPAGADADALVKQMRDILNASITNGVSAELVDAAKRHEIADAEFQKNSVSGLAMEWSAAVAGEGRQSPDEDVDAIRKVTVADVNRVARQCLDWDHAVTAVLSPQPSGKPVSSKGFGGKESFASTTTNEVTLPGWAEQAVNRMEIPASGLNPEVTKLPNGVRLIVQPETVSDTVSVFGEIKNRAKVEMPKGKDGVDRVLDELFSYGTKSLDRIAFQKALDDIAASESAGTSFSLQVLSDKFERGVELLADNELSPALPEEAFQVILPEITAAVAGELKSPGHKAGLALNGALFPTNDPVQRDTTPESVKALSIQDVRDYYHLAFRPDLATIVVIGKVTPEQAKAVVTKYFGQWKAEGPAPETLLPPAPRNGAATVAVPDASRVQDEVTLAETLSVTRTNEDYYALELGDHVLGGGFYATRLYHDLRKETGLVYFVSSSFQLGLTRGVYRAQYACDPPNVSKARAILVRDLQAMRTTEVSPRELNQAKVLLLREIPLSEASLDGIAHGWLSRVSLDLPLDEPVQAARRYVKLSAADVRAAFEKWLRPEDLVQVTQGPEPK